MRVMTRFSDHLSQFLLAKIYEAFGTKLHLTLWNENRMGGGGTGLPARWGPWMASLWGCGWGGGCGGGGDGGGGVVEWVPVDVARQLETSSRVPPLDRVWPYFGRHEGLDTTIPLSFHFVLPDTESPLIRPGLWGYRGKLAMPPMTTDIEFEAHTPSKRGDDPPDPYAP